jgi:PAS domain S-box-containing protein
MSTPNPLVDRQRHLGEAPQCRIEELATSLSLLHATLESTADGIVALDLAGRVVTCNTKFTGIWRYPAELFDRADRDEMMAYAARQVKDSEAFLECIRRRQAEPEVEGFDIIEMKDGRTFERYQFPQKVNGECAGVVVTFRDITERKRDEVDLARLAAIVASSDDAIIGKTLEGVITSWNQGAQRLFGYAAEEVIGCSVLLLIPPYLHDEETMILSRLRHGERVEHFETVRLKKGGEPVNISLTVSPIHGRDGTIIGASKIARDITERKHAETERALLLQRERAARAEAEAANRARDEFLAIVSHELRTPLHSMMGWAELLTTDAVSPDDIKRGLEIILRNIRMQTRLINDLLDVSRIITGKLDLELRAVTLNQLLLDSVEMIYPEAESKGVALKTMIPSDVAPLPGDPQRLQQCIWNLLSNAVKFTPSGGEVEVRLTSSDTEACIEVRDTGIGISADFLPYVFDRLRQADSSATRGRAGLGLGLSIVRHIVELHGGTVKAESEGEGKGATFTITLPRVHPA